MDANTLFTGLMLAAMLLTLLALGAGLVVMAKGGVTNVKYGNNLMRARVILQGIAIALFVLAVASR